MKANNLWLFLPIIYNLLVCVVQMLGISGCVLSEISGSLLSRDICGHFIKGHRQYRTIISNILEYIYILYSI